MYSPSGGEAHSLWEYHRRTGELKAGVLAELNKVITTRRREIVDVERDLGAVLKDTMWLAPEPRVIALKNPAGIKPWFGSVRAYSAEENSTDILFGLLESVAYQSKLEALYRASVAPTVEGVSEGGHRGEPDAFVVVADALRDQRREEIVRLGSLLEDSGIWFGDTSKTVARRLEIDLSAEQTDAPLSDEVCAAAARGDGIAGVNVIIHAAQKKITQHERALYERWKRNRGDDDADRHRRERKAAAREAGVAGQPYDQYTSFAAWTTRFRNETLRDDAATLEQLKNIDTNSGLDTAVRDALCVAQHYQGATEFALWKVTNAPREHRVSREQATLPEFVQSRAEQFAQRAFDRTKQCKSLFAHLESAGVTLVGTPADNASSASRVSSVALKEMGTQQSSSPNPNGSRHRESGTESPARRAVGSPSRFNAISR